MRKVFITVFLMIGPLALAQDEMITLDDVVESAGQWAKENLDEDALRVLQTADQKKVKQFFDNVQKEFQGEYVVDLAQLREGAKLILPLLEAHEETVPYAA